VEVRLKQKIKLPKLSKKIFPYDFYVCHWIDINSNCSWESLNTVKQSVPTICITTGWLVGTENNCHKFVGDINFDDDKTLGDCGNTTTIPAQNIIKLRKVKLW